MTKTTILQIVPIIIVLMAMLLGCQLAIDDSQILTDSSEATPPTPETDPDATLASIVADVAAGGTRYVGKIVTITATVEFHIGSSDIVRDLITLVTDNDEVNFYVETFNKNVEGRSYTFKLFIEKITTDFLFIPKDKSIWAHEVD